MLGQYCISQDQVLGWIFSSPAGISNCLQEQRRVDTSFSVFVFEIAAIFPHRSCAYCTSPRSGQYTYPLPWAATYCRYTKKNVNTVQWHSSHPKTNIYWGFVRLFLALNTNYNQLCSRKYVKILLRPFWTHFTHSKFQEQGSVGPI